MGIRAKIQKDGLTKDTYPPLGICIPVKYARCRDGDTPEFETRMGNRIAIRMIGIDTPEKNEPGYELATMRLIEKLREAEEIRVFIPLAKTGPDGRLDIFDILRQATFDRVPGYVFADGRMVT